MDPSPPLRRVPWRGLGCASALAVVIVLPYVGLWRLIQGTADRLPAPTAAPPALVPADTPPRRHPPVDSHPEGYEWVHGHQHASKWVEGYWRRRPGFVPPTPTPPTQ